MNKLSPPIKHRNWHFEALRIFAMLCIVATHYFAADNWVIHVDPEYAHSLANAMHDALTIFGQVGVTIFVLISAYFSVGKTFCVLPRVVKMWIQIFVYSAGIFVIFIILKYYNVIPERYRGIGTIHDTLSSFLPVTFRVYWFMSAFIVLTIVSPLLNRFFEVLTGRQLLTLTGIVVYTTFIWKLLNPAIMYFTDILYFISIYCIGACIREFSHNIKRLHGLVVIAITLGGYVIVTLGTWLIKRGGHFVQIMGYPGNLLTSGPGASPIFAVLIGSVIFLYVVQHENLHQQQLKFSTIGKIILHVSPATFGVYLIHENFIVKPMIWDAVFAMPQPSGVMKVPYAVASIMVIYTLLLAISYCVLHWIVQPVTRLIVK